MHAQSAVEPGTQPSRLSCLQRDDMSSSTNGSRALAVSPINHSTLQPCICCRLHCMLHFGFAQIIDIYLNVWARY
jgi:hypothetical protein